jgi:hypothetical protein
LEEGREKAGWIYKGKEENNTHELIFIYFIEGWRRYFL